MSEPRAIYTVATPAWEQAENLDLYAAELRSARGIPPDQGAEPWDEAIRRPAFDPAHQPQADIYMDWSAPDREALAEIQADVREVLISYHDAADIDWIVEETLTQLRCRLHRTGHLRIPQACELRLQRTCEGRRIAGEMLPGLPGWRVAP